MCYNVKALLHSQLIRAKNRKRFEEVRQIEERLREIEMADLYQASGYAHPRLIIYTDQDATPVPSIWGLIPGWVKDNDQRLQLWNSTLNARSETMFEKPSFRDSARSKRCLIYLDGFYESHHQGGNTFPFFIRRKDAEPFAVGGLWSDWVDKKTGQKWTTFSIVTTVGNGMLSKIHNNPKLEGPRMPVILPDELADEWIDYKNNEKTVLELCRPFADDALHAHPVDRIAGKLSKGNVPGAEDEVNYPDLKLVV